MPFPIKLPFRHWALVIAHWSFALAAFAQSPDPSRLVTLRFLFLDEAPGAFSLKVGAGYQNLGPTPYVISAPQQLPADIRLELYKELPDPTTGQTVRTRVLTRSIPADLLHALVVLSPVVTVDEDGTRNYTARFYDSDPAKSPPRSVRVLNLSSSALAARFGADEIQVAPGESKTLRPAPDTRGRLRTFIGVNVHNSEGWQLIYNSFISLRENQHLTGILVYSPSGLLHTYSEDELLMLGPPKPGHFWLTFTDPP